MFAITSITIISYLPIFWLLRKTNYISALESWIKKEIWIISILLSVFYLIGIFESDPDHGVLSILFAFSLILQLTFIYIYYRNQKKGNDIILSKWSLFKFTLWWLGIHLFFIFIFIITYTFETRATQDGRVVLLVDDDLFVEFLAPILFVSFFVFVINWIVRQIKSIINLKNEKSKTELLHLKSQVNPHFFFNTLNNLYGLVEEDTQKAQALILKLSDMMRYSIYEGQNDFVTIKEEIAYLKNYIELHKMRYHKKTDVRFNLHVQDESYKVMPLLFIILLENAFKHGVENLREDAYVYINLNCAGNRINFTVENNFDKTEIPDKPGIGLKNLKRRLELIYPKKHSLFFTTQEEVYKVQLTLKQL
ncbi:sensor histidine kinase [Aquimarina sp. 2201CG5-10]|uniref:sensor histidine kinase n=1 Tax=Aquimarina callyspongiae TaxID=3098150 RepID=UPI002AB59E33|nr:histidine kinase [Aquimarina sp. 2201CG5-10]MDY8135905.1 histidine kinase [Aquimarina sp. 2201CG5-10]